MGFWCLWFPDIPLASIGVMAYPIDQAKPNAIVTIIVISGVINGYVLMKKITLMAMVQDN